MRESAIISIFFKFLVLCSLIVIPVQGDVLSPDQKAPPFARGSGGFALPLPLEGQPKLAVSQPVGNNLEDGVHREEVSSFKKIGDETIRVVEGNFGYKSPEGLAISVNYKADENGNRASFKFGSGLSGGSQPGGGGANKGGPSKGGAGPSSYLPPNKNGKTDDRSYLPPS